ncbi:MAG: SdpI family protein [Halobacteriaceae archaeon]
MNSGQRFGVAAALVVLGAVVSVLAAPDLPAEIVTRWSAAGEPVATMDKMVGLAIVPALTAVLLAVFWVIPRIDPLRENIAEFRGYYDWFVILFALFMTALQIGIVAYNLGYTFDFTVFVLVAVAALFYYLGILLANAERNWFVGIRTPWTLSSDAVWARTHALGSRLFKLTAAIALVGVLFGDYAVYFLVVPAVLTAIVVVGYSYYLYESLERDGVTG